MVSAIWHGAGHLSLRVWPLLAIDHDPALLGRMHIQRKPVWRLHFWHRERPRAKVPWATVAIECAPLHWKDTYTEIANVVCVVWTRDGPHCCSGCYCCCCERAHFLCREAKFDDSSTFSRRRSIEETTVSHLGDLF